MCFFGGGGSSAQPVYQAATTPAPVTAKAVELNEEEDLVTDDAQSKKKGQDTLRTDLTDPLGISSNKNTTSRTGLNLLSQ